MKTMKRVFLAAGILALIAYVGARVHRKVTSRPAPGIRQIQVEEGLPVEVIRVVPALFSTSLAATGQVVSEEEAAVSATYGGRILSFPREIGDTVRRGDTLATLDTTQLRIQHSQALQHVGRMERLFAESVVSEKEVERARLRLEAAVQRHEAALAQVKAAQEAVRIIEHGIEESVVTAPFSGVVCAKMASAGEVVAPGRPLLTLANLERLTCSVSLPENDLPLLRPGQEAVVSFDAFPGKTYPASVLRIAGAPRTDTRMFEVHLRLRERPAGIRPGLFVKAEIITRRSVGVLAVPEEAVFTGSEGPTVFTVQEAAARLTPVVLGDRANGSVEIRSGLAPGDLVVISGREMLTDGAKVRVRTVENEQ